MTPKEINYSNQPKGLIHDCLKVLPNDMKKAKERVKYGIIQDKKSATLAPLADGVIETIYTNIKSGRWVTASIDPITGAFFLL